MKHFIFFLFRSNPFVFLQFSYHFPKLQTWHMSMIFWQSNTLLGTPITECCRQLFRSKKLLLMVIIESHPHRFHTHVPSYSPPTFLFHYKFFYFLFFIFPFLFYCLEKVPLKILVKLSLYHFPTVVAWTTRGTVFICLKKFISCIAYVFHFLHLNHSNSAINKECHFHMLSIVLLLINNI